MGKQPLGVMVNVVKGFKWILFVSDWRVAAVDEGSCSRVTKSFSSTKENKSQITFYPVYTDRHKRFLKLLLESREILALFLFS